MAHKRIRVWWDAEADLLSVSFDDEDGYMTETDDGRVMAKIDENGDVVGFQVVGATSQKGSPFEVYLKSKESRGASK